MATASLLGLVPSSAWRCRQNRAAGKQCHGSLTVKFYCNTLNVGSGHRLHMFRAANEFQQENLKEGPAYKDSGGDLLKDAGIIGAATAISKVLGLLRELVLAAVFGVGPVVDAFGYASIIPGFFLAVLGGINGPIHLTMTAALSKLSEAKGRELVEKTSSTTLLVSIGLSIFLCIFAAPIIDAFAPGLRSGENVGLLTRSMAVIQLRLMVPSLVLASLIGIGYGRLSAVRIYGIPSLSPGLSSISIIFAAAIYFLAYGSSPNLMAGAILLAIASTLGAFAQWSVQSTVQGHSRLQFSWENPFQNENVREVFSLMITAAVGSGMLQFATYTDLYFASYFPQAAASLGYANLLVMAPLGIVSSAVLIPMLPMFSRLSEPSKWPELRSCVRQALHVCMALTLPMTAIMVPLAKPIVRIVFQRYAFVASAAETVSSLVVYYVLGSTFYLARDLLVRVFYALGDGQSPFYISTAAILANAILDWLLVRKAGFGPGGLVMATTLVNFLSAIALLLLLSRKLGGFRLREWVWSLGALSMCAAVTANITAFSYKWSHLLLLSNLSKRSWWIGDLVSIALSSFLGGASFLLLSILLIGKEVKSLLKLSHKP